MKADFGFLILAIKKDYKKAIALSLRIRQLMPGIPIAVATSPPSLAKKIQNFFDDVVHQDPTLKGFEHKIYLDKYSPYTKTLFLDADILMINEISETLNQWSGSDYAVRGYLVNNGMSSFGLDREKALTLLKKTQFSNIDGAGHAYFEKPGCVRVFEEARKITKDYEVFGTNKFADEDVMGLALTKLNIKPKNNEQFLGSPWCAINNSFKIDVAKNFCSYNDQVHGVVHPKLVHFAALIKPFTYAREMQKVFKAQGLSYPSVYYDATLELAKSVKLDVSKKARQFFKFCLSLLR